jgi:hypothetical protein
MTKEEIFELKKEIVIFRDFKEFLKNEQNSDIKKIEIIFKEKYKNLNEVDKNWVNKKFDYWFDLYTLRNTKNTNCHNCKNCG